MLQCKNVTKKYMKMTAVNGVSIDFMPGRIYALLGSNGSGKTTLMKMKLTPDMKASKMSSGMMAKLKLAVNLSRNASVIMLDEPLNGVDIVAREQVINAVISKASPDKIIIMSSHLVDELEAVIDYAVFIKDGVIVSQGDAENLRTASGMSIVDQYKRIYAY